ncbi:helicase HerA-like domain-containing protein [Microbacterium plantarum]|nr:helicase HerA-like domain-containing protein [Microbacterium plantarum]WRK18952.1 helicase HerA-like domain-containing protein [Microbacterium plantarum]
MPSDDAIAAADLARLRAEAEAAEAALVAARARAALAAAEAAAARAGSAPAGDSAPSAPTGEPEPSAAGEAEPSGAAVPLDRSEVDDIRRGYTFDGPVLELGALLNGEPQRDALVRIPLAMTNRHGLVAGATGTGKTRTLQVLVEQLAANGVPVFAADIKGDLSGLASAGEPSEKLLSRTSAIGQDWSPRSFATEFLALGGRGAGTPVRATVSGFGPLLLSRVLGLNATQESSLGLVFHYADANGLALVDLADLRAVLTYLTSDDGKAELAELGGLSKATAGVILRELITFADAGADVFFGEPEFDVRDLMRTTDAGEGIVTLLEVPGVADRPVLYSTFLMYLLAELFEVLPEVGDVDKPELVFFFDEAHLLFRDASKDFLAAVVQTVRLIRSKGVGVFFVTQTPKDVPSDVLAQLGSRVQHALRAFTPDDVKALRASVGTYPRSGYDLERVLQELGTGEAVVTVMNEKGAPTPVAWTRLRAPQASMSPAAVEDVQARVAASEIRPRYAEAVDRESAREILTARMNAAQAALDAAEAEAARRKAEQDAAKLRAKADAAYAKQLAAIRKQAAADEAKERRDDDRMLRSMTSNTRSRRRTPAEQILGSRAAQEVLTGVIRGIFGTGRR